MLFLIILGVAWWVYSVLTTAGMLEFPAYRGKDKLKAALLIWCIPFYGAWRVNRNMGHRIDDAAKIELCYELPWWSNTGLRVVEEEIDD